MVEINTPAKPQESVNTFNFVGSVTHKFRPSPDVIILSFGLRGRDANSAYYPNVVFYGQEVADRIDKSVIVEKGNYPRMSVTGTVQTHRKLVGDRAEYFQNFVGEKLVTAPSRMEALSGVRGIGQRKADSVNTVCLLGEVAGIYPITKPNVERPIGVIVTLRIPGEHVNFPRMTCFSSLVPVASGLKRGDVVCMTGSVETSFREKNGERKRFESIIASEIHVVSRAAE